MGKSQGKVNARELSDFRLKEVDISVHKHVHHFKAIGRY
jgi:hypothetical protein